MVAETMKEAASSAKTTPAEAEATSTPPIAGPAIRKTIGRISWSSAFACASRSGGTMSGTSASNAGAKNAAPVPYTAAMTAMCQTSMAWVRASTASAAPATARSRSAATITKRRSKRSLATPPISKKTMVGTVIAMPTTDIAVGAFDSSYTCQATATRKAPSPSSDTHIAIQSLRNSGSRSGRSRPTRVSPPDLSRASWL